MATHPSARRDPPLQVQRRRRQVFAAHWQRAVGLLEGRLVLLAAPRTVHPDDAGGGLPQLAVNQVLQARMMRKLAPLNPPSGSSNHTSLVHRTQPCVARRISVAPISRAGRRRRISGATPSLLDHLVTAPRYHAPPTPLHRRHSRATRRSDLHLLLGSICCRCAPRAAHPRV